MVEYADPRYAGELFEHGLRGTPVKLRRPLAATKEVASLPSITEEAAVSGPSTCVQCVPDPVRAPRATRRQQRIADIKQAALLIGDGSQKLIS